jgi:hypothetical protein
MAAETMEGKRTRGIERHRVHDKASRTFSSSRHQPRSVVPRRCLCYSLVRGRKTTFYSNHQFAVVNFDLCSTLVRRFPLLYKPSAGCKSCPWDAQRNEHVAPQYIHAGGRVLPRWPRRVLCHSIPPVASRRALRRCSSSPQRLK